MKENSWADYARTCEGPSSKTEPSPMRVTNSFMRLFILASLLVVKITQERPA